MTGPGDALERSHPPTARPGHRLLEMVKRMDVALGVHPTAGPELTGATPGALAAVNTSLALERTYLATERTLMAWIRTALSMISFGFTLGKISQAMLDPKFVGLFHMAIYSVRDIAYVLVTLGTFSLAGATAQHLIRVRGLYALGFPRQFSFASASAVLLIFLGLFAFTALLLNL